MSQEEITIDPLLAQPMRVSRFVQEIFGDQPNLWDHWHRYETDPEYRAECDRKRAEEEAERARIEAERRAALSPWQRWREDNPYFFRRLFPWKIVRWRPPVEIDEDEL